jgi:hypothetical protein
VSGLRAKVAAAFAATVSHCSWFADPATSLVLVLEKGAAQLESSPAFKATIVHPPNSSDCPGAYRVRLEQQGPLTVWCEGSPASHTTTQHLETVDVRETTTVDKKAGEPLSFEIAKSAGKPVIERVF